METRQRAREQQAAADALTGGAHIAIDAAAGGGGDGVDGEGQGGDAAAAGGGDAVGGRGDGVTHRGHGEDTGTGGGGGDDQRRHGDRTAVAIGTTTTDTGNDDNEEDDDDDALVPDPVDFVQVRAFKTFLRYIGFTSAAVKQILARGLSSMDSLQGQEKNLVENMCKCIERGTGILGVPLNSDSIKWLKLGTYAIKRRQYCGWQTFFLVSTLLYVLQLFCANARRSFPLVDTLPLQLIS
jgi:hypothetical protein